MPSLTSNSPKKSNTSYSSHLQLSTMSQQLPRPSPAAQQSQQNSRNSYGNMVVLLQIKSKNLLVSLGPDYWCFLIAMILFTILHFFTIKQIYAKDGYEILGTITLIGAVIQQLSYFLIALSNPGITTKADFSSQVSELQQPNKVRRFCRECNLPMLPRSRHCSTCNVCIKGYDHHCPWTSKCIGENNLYRFYFFASYTPLFILYSIFMISII